MHKVTFDLPEARQININGDVFTILKSDIDIMEKALEMNRRYGLADKDDMEAVTAAVRDCVAYVDEVLGGGAMAKITKGRPLGLVAALDIMTLICRESIKAYNERLDDAYA